MRSGIRKVGEAGTGLQTAWGAARGLSPRPPGSPARRGWGPGVSEPARSLSSGPSPATRFPSKVLACPPGPAYFFFFSAFFFFPKGGLHPTTTTTTTMTQFPPFFPWPPPGKPITLLCKQKVRAAFGGRGGRAGEGARREGRARRRWRWRRAARGGGAGGARRAGLAGGRLAGAPRAL